MTEEPINPDPQDFAAVEATPGTEAEKYRLAQAHKLVRLYEAGKLPLDLMRGMDKLPRK